MAQDDRSSGKGPRMRGGYGGEGYANYGRNHGRGAQGGGAEGPRFGDYGSRPSGAPRRFGSEGEENYDRGYGRPGDSRSIGQGYRGGRDYGAGPGHVAFGYRPRPADIGHRGRGPRNYIRSDERIREDINDHLTEDEHVDASDIEVAVKRGEVTLTGTVESRSARRRAEDLADAVLGVTHVQNNLRVHIGGPAHRTGGSHTGGGGTVSGGTPEPSTKRARGSRSVARRSAAADAAASGNPGTGGAATGAPGTPAGGRTTSPRPKRAGRTTVGRARLADEEGEG